MIVAVIILSIMLIGSVVFNILLFSSKNLSEKQTKKTQKENRELKSENIGLRDTNTQLEGKIKSYEKTIRGFGGKNDEISNLQAEVDQKKGENASLKSENEVLRKQLDSNEDILKTITEQKKQIADLKDNNEKLTARVKDLEDTVPTPAIPDGKPAEFDELVKKQKGKIDSLTSELDKKNEKLIIVRQSYETASKKSVELQNTREELKIQIAGCQTQLLSAQKQNAELSAKVNLLLADKSELEKKNNQLLQQIQQAVNPDETLLAQISQLNRDNKTLKSNIDESRSQIAKKEKKITEIESEITKLKEQIDSSSVPGDEPGKEPYKEPKFPIDSEVVQFKDGEYDDTLKRLLDISVITEYLQNSTHEKAPRYLKQVKSYADEIKDLEEFFSRLDADEDEISSECISKFSKIFNEYMAENVIESVFKAKNDDEFYSGLLETIIKYAANCGFYTKEITVGNKFENINFMEVITEDTTDLSQHKIISRIFRLPFYAKYTSETGKVREKLLSKGSCVVLKAK